MKSVNVFTLGCQMNVYDSEQILRLLSPLGYEVENDPEKADLVILNTCSIRQKAADKAFSFLGRIKGRKKSGANVFIGVGGCVAQQDKKEILTRAPYVDFVFGTSAIHRLPEIIKRVEGGEKVVDTGEDEDIIEPGSDDSLPDKYSPSGFVSIMRGCNNFCTYCIVPFVRGREKSRDHKEILSEIKRRADLGMSEVTLLGQNVNSYGKKDGMPNFPTLLHMVSEIDGIKRVRFATSHPKDLSDELVDCFKDNDKLCRHFHIPVQSGSNEILKRMSRKYTREHYLDRIYALKSVCPEIELSTDIIVGFPGESDKDFNATFDLINEVEYDSIFGFAYSDRPGTKASSLSFKTDDKVKKERLNRLLDRQNEITRKKNKSFEGRKLEILVERLELKNDNDKVLKTFINGRSFGNRIVHLKEDACKYDDFKTLMGKLLNVEVTDALGHSLKGKIV